MPHFVQIKCWDCRLRVLYYEFSCDTNEVHVIAVNRLNNYCFTVNIIVVTVMRPSIQVAKGLRVRYYDNSILYICARPNWSDAKIAKAIKNNFPINKWEKRLVAGRMSSNMSMIGIRTHIATIRNASEVVICENNDFVKFQ